MESFFSRFKNTLVLIALLLAQTIGLATQVRRPSDAAHGDGAQVRLLRLWTVAIVAPFERALSWSGHGITGAWSGYIDLRNVRKQNLQLQKEMAALKLQRAALAEDALEAKRLRTLLDFKQQYVATTVLARVIGTSGSDQSRLLTLDKGADSGLKPDMAVITPDGIVGKLRDVFPGTSQLLLLDDATAGAGVVFQTTRMRAVVRGTPQGRMVITSLMPDDRIKPGDTVLSSGGDQVFPRGLPVGTIESIAPDPDHQPYTTIVLKPAANLNRLEEVLVITGTSPNGDVTQERDLLADSALSSEERAQANVQASVQAHAADLNAARLPSLHGGGSPDGTTSSGVADSAPPPENSTKLVPRPKPALHPDRYSAGSAPAADQLTPGASQGDAAHRSEPRQ